MWTSLEEMLQEAEPDTATPQPSKEDVPAKKRSFLLLASDSDSDEDKESGVLHRYRAEPSISMDECPLEWWSTHAGAYGKLSSLATPASSVPCERLFSLAGNIIQKKRAALNSENVNKLVCLSN